MPTPAVSLRLKRFRHRFGIAAPRVVVRSEVPRYWLFLGGLVLVIAGFVLAWFVQAGRYGGGQFDALNKQLDAQRAELLELRASVGTGQSAVSMERAAQQQLLAKIQLLETENAALKEDMLIFERLIPVAGQEAQIRVESFRIVSNTLGGYRYRLLLAYQSVQRGVAFQGRYEIHARYRSADGQLGETQFPLGAASRLEVRHFLRREGEIELPEGAVLISVEARIYQGGKLLTKEALQI